MNDNTPSEADSIFDDPRFWRFRRACEPTKAQQEAAARKWHEHDKKWRTPFYRPWNDAKYGTLADQDVENQ